MKLDVDKKLDTRCNKVELLNTRCTVALSNTRYDKVDCCTVATFGLGPSPPTELPRARLVSGDLSGFGSLHVGWGPGGKNGWVTERGRIGARNWKSSLRDELNYTGS